MYKGHAWGINFGFYRERLAFFFEIIFYWNNHLHSIMMVVVVRVILLFRIPL